MTTFKDLGYFDFDFKFNSNDPKIVQEQIDALADAFSDLTDEDGKIDFSIQGASDLQVVFTQLMHEKQAFEATDGNED